MHEIEMRIDGIEDPGRFREVEAAVTMLDVTAGLRLDPATGILHVATRADTLDVVEALSSVGIAATAMTG